MELANNTKLLFWCGASKHNLVVGAKLVPLVFVESDELRAAQNNGFASLGFGGVVDDFDLICGKNFGARES